MDVCCCCREILALQVYRSQFEYKAHGWDWNQVGMNIVGSLVSGAIFTTVAYYVGAHIYTKYFDPNRSNKIQSALPEQVMQPSSGAEGNTSSVIENETAQDVHATCDLPQSALPEHVIEMHPSSPALRHRTSVIMDESAQDVHATCDLPQSALPERVIEMHPSSPALRHRTSVIMDESAPGERHSDLTHSRIIKKTSQLDTS